MIKDTAFKIKLKYHEKENSKCGVVFGVAWRYLHKLLQEMLLRSDTSETNTKGNRAVIGIKQRLSFRLRGEKSSTTSKLKRQVEEDTSLCSV